jgi:hypothetical protein
LINQYPIRAVPIIDPRTTAMSPPVEIPPVGLAIIDESEEVVFGDKVLGISGDIILL